MVISINKHTQRFTLICTKPPLDMLTPILSPYQRVDILAIFTFHSDIFPRFHLGQAFTPPKLLLKVTLTISNLMVNFHSNDTWHA